MKIAPSHARETSDKIFIQVEFVDTVDGTRGNLLDYDLTNNRGVAGIEADTIGLRVVNHSPGGDFLDPFTAGILETAVQAVEANAKVGRMVLAQIYGVHDDAQYGGGSYSPGAGYILPHNGTLGAMTAQAIAAVNSNPQYVNSQVGWNLANSGATFATKPMFVQMM